MPDVITGDTQLGATKQDVIAALVQAELRLSSILLPTVMDVSQFAKKGAKSISFPKFASFLVTERASGTAGDAQTLLSAADKLELDIPAYLAYIIDSNDEMQSTVEVEGLFAKYAATAHGRYVDAKIIAELVANVGFKSVASAVTEDIILNQREFLLANKANMNALTLMISPDQEKLMLKIANFVQAQLYGQSNIPNGVIGRVYGVPVMVHSEAPDATCVMYEKSGLAVGFQKGPTMASQPANEYGAGSVRVAIDQLYGCKALQIDVGDDTANGGSGLICAMLPS